MGADPMKPGAHNFTATSEPAKEDSAVVGWYATIQRDGDVPAVIQSIQWDGITAPVLRAGDRLVIEAFLLPVGVARGRK